MRNIKINTIWLVTGYFIVLLANIVSAQNHAESLIVVFSGIIGVLLIFDVAIDIADFEMSAVGQIVSNIENSDTGKIDVSKFARTYTDNKGEQ